MKQEQADNFYHFFCPLPTSQEIGQWDKCSVGLGLPLAVLMENAARAAFAVVCQIFGAQPDIPCLGGKRILLFMGPGNNGGDALCLARHLKDAGATVLVAHSRDLSNSLVDEASPTALYTALAQKLGIACIAGEKLLQGHDFQPHLVVDGLLGTGFTGKVREAEAKLIAQINFLGRHCPVLALDVPSGLAADSFQDLKSDMPDIPDMPVVRASVTVTFQAPKPALLLPHNAPWVGTLRVMDIGIPELVRRQNPPSMVVLRALCPKVLSPALALPKFSPGHKGEAGHVLVLGGSPGMSGACILAAWGALRAGAGLVTVAAPPQSLVGLGPDFLCHAMPFAESATSKIGKWQVNKEFLASLNKYQALVLGPGIGRALADENGEGGARGVEGVPQVLRDILSQPGRPAAVLDADALFALAQEPALLELVQACDILTPHPKEAALLLGLNVAQVQQNRLAALNALRGLAPGHWVLKGTATLSGGSQGPVFLCPLDIPTLAVAGSGDVLAGAVGAFLARGQEWTAPVAVALHALAGMFLAKHFPARGNSALEIAHALPQAANFLFSKNAKDKQKL